MKMTTFLGAAAAATLCVTVALVAQEAQDAAAPSPEALARMTPGPMHAKLEPLVGSWTMSGKWRMTPDGPWSEFEATVEREWILGGRFVQETVKSEFMGEAFEGMALIGYDNTREEFTMVWVENMSTGTWFHTGQMEGAVITFEGEHSDGMTGQKNAWGRSVLDLSTDEHVYTGFAKDADGNEFKNMKMASVRN